MISVRFAVTCALERLSVSNSICQLIEVEGVIYPLLNALKHIGTSGTLMEKTLDILVQILDPGKEMKSKFYDVPVNGSKKGLNAMGSPYATIQFVGNMDVTAASKPTTRKDVIDFAIARLVEILKTPSPNLQRKASSILKFLTIIEPHLDRNSSVIYVGITVTGSIRLLSGILRNGTISMVCVASVFSIPKTSMKSYQLRKEKQVVMAKIKKLRDDLKDIDIEINSLMEELKAVSEKRVSLRSLWLVTPWLPYSFIQLQLWGTHSCMVCMATFKSHVLSFFFYFTYLFIYFI